MSNSEQRPNWMDSLLISIQDASNLGGVSKGEILKAASNGKIELLFEVLPGQELVLRPHSYVSAWERPLIGIADSLMAPEYLVLRPKLCDFLLRSPTVDVSDAECGYKKHLILIFSLKIPW